MIPPVKIMSVVLQNCTGQVSSSKHHSADVRAITHAKRVFICGWEAWWSRWPDAHNQREPTTVCYTRNADHHASHHIYQQDPFGLLTARLTITRFSAGLNQSLQKINYSVLPHLSCLPLRQWIIIGVDNHKRNVTRCCCCSSVLACFSCGLYA